MTPSELKLASKYRAFEVDILNMERGKSDFYMMNGRLLPMALVMAVVGTMSASPATAAPALPGKPCEEKPHSDWIETVFHLQVAHIHRSFEGGAAHNEPPAHLGASQVHVLLEA